jgi:hypothetical protein
MKALLEDSLLLAAVVLNVCDGRMLTGGLRIIAQKNLVTLALLQRRFFLSLAV